MAVESDAVGVYVHPDDLHAVFWRYRAEATPKTTV